MTSSTRKTFRVALTADFYFEDGSPRYRETGLELLAQHPAMESCCFEKHLLEIQPDQIGDVQGVIVLTPRVTAQSLSQSRDLLAIGRFGVGYDAVDVEACTQADIAMFIAEGAVDHSVAEATVGWMLSLAHRTQIKDRLVRDGNWDQRSAHMGCELRDRTLGIIGLGHIGSAVINLLRGFGMKEPLAYDPYADPEVAKSLGVRCVELDELLESADFVSIHCPLIESTRGLIGSGELDKMKSEAFLINTARGGIVDEDALYTALSQQQIAGAAIDCFVDEPIGGDHRFAQLDNILLAPHAIAWTDELFRDIGRAVCRGMIDLALGKRPRGIVNPEVFDKPSFQQKWTRLQPPDSSHALPGSHLHESLPAKP